MYTACRNAFILGARSHLWGGHPHHVCIHSSQDECIHNTCTLPCDLKPPQTVGKINKTGRPAKQFVRWAFIH